MINCEVNVPVGGVATIEKLWAVEISAEFSSFVSICSGVQLVSK